MKKVIYHFSIDYQKEEQWLNEQSKKGLHLTKVQFPRYIFEEGIPGEYIYRNELLKGIGNKQDKAYLEFLEDSGIEFVDKFGFWGYFRKKAAEGPFELYTDASSKISYLNRILYLFGFALLLNLFAFIMNFSLDGANRWFSYVSLTCVILMCSVSYTVYKRKKALKAEQQIFHQ